MCFVFVRGSGLEWDGNAMGNPQLLLSFFLTLMFFSFGVVGGQGRGGSGGTILSVHGRGGVCGGRKGRLGGTVLGCWLWEGCGDPCSGVQRVQSGVDKEYVCLFLILKKVTLSVIPEVYTMLL